MRAAIRWSLYRPTRALTANRPVRRLEGSYYRHWPAGGHRRFAQSAIRALLVKGQQSILSEQAALVGPDQSGDGLQAWRAA
jgi:hypothetical protein